MEVLEPVTRVIIPLVIGKRKTELPFETRGEVRDLITALADLMARLPDDGSGLLALITVDEDGVIQPGDEPEPLPLRALAAEMPVPCSRRNAHTPHRNGSGACPGTAPEYPGEAVETVRDEPEPLPQRTPGAALAVTPADVLCQWHGGEGVSGPPCLQCIAEDAPVAVAAVPAGELPPCPEHHPVSSSPCARLSGHEPPHRALDRTEWDDGPAPYHATGGLQCAVRDGHYFCTAQRGHGGAVHIAYGASGEVCHRWPVAAPAAEPGAAYKAHLDAVFAPVRAEVGALREALQDAATGAADAEAEAAEAVSQP